MAAVQLQGVSKRYDHKNTVIHGLDLEIRQGEFVVFVGPSGCGKSTLLRMVAGLETTSGGEIRIGDKRVNELPPRARDIAMVFQDYALYPHKTLYENMAFGLRLRKTPEAEITRRVTDAARALHIEHLLQRRPAQLSGGQRQRVAIGRAIVRQPEVFLFDEPLSNLDAQLRGEMRVEIKRLHQRLGATIIYVTHDQVEAMTLADRIAVLSAGRLMQYGTPDEIYHQPAALFVAGFTGAPPMNLLPCTLAGDAAVLDGASIALPVALARKAAGAGALRFGIRPENLGLTRQQPDDVEVGAEVSLIEPLGAETLVTFRIGTHEETPSRPKLPRTPSGGQPDGWTVGTVELVGRCPTGFRESVGTRRTLYLNPAHMHLFRADTGAAIR